MGKNRILRYADLIEIVDWITVNEYETAIKEITMSVPNHKVLEKLNEDFYYRSERPEGEDSVPEVGDEINVTINGITFKYVVEGEEGQAAN